MVSGHNYKLYKFSIYPKGAFQTKLQSDTFFGAFCWSYKYLYSEEALENLLLECMGENVPIVFSNGFSLGYLPLGINFDPSKSLFRDKMNKAERKVAYSKLKEYKRLSEITIKGFIDYRSGREIDFRSLEKKKITSIESIHNLVPRKMSGESDDTLLFTTEDYFVEEGDGFDVYALSLLEENIIKPTIELMLELGIGAKKSTGKGGFYINGWTDVSDLLVCENANGFIALSNFIPRKGDPIKGYYQTFVKNAKIDRNFEGNESPFKKPLLFISAGAVFYDEKVKPIYGRCLKNIAQNPDIVTNACTIALPIAL